MATSVKPPGNIFDDSAVGTLTWVNPTFAYTSNSQYATASVASSTADTHYLHFDTFNMAIPAWSTINGITVKVIRKASINNGATEYVRDTRISLVDSSGAVVAANKGVTATNWLITNVTVNYGGATDLWGALWGVADINSNNFGVVVEARIKSGGLTARIASIDYVEITVDYTAGSAPASTGNFLMFF